MNHEYNDKSIKTFNELFIEEIDIVKSKFLEKQPLYNQFLINDPQFNILLESFCFVSAGIKDHIQNQNLNLETKIQSILYKNYNPYVLPKSFLVEVVPNFEKTKKPYVIGQKIFFNEHDNTYEFFCSEKTILPIKLENIFDYGTKIQLDFVCSDFINDWDCFDLEIFLNYPKSIFFFYSIYKEKCFFVTENISQEIQKKWPVFNNTIYEQSNSLNFFMNYKEDDFLLKKIIIPINTKIIKEKTKKFSIIFNTKKKIGNIDLKKEHILLNALVVRSFTNKTISYINNNYENTENILSTENDYKIFSIQEVFFLENNKKSIIPEFFNKNKSDYFWFWEFCNKDPVLKICSENEYTKVINKQIFCSVLQIYVFDSDLFFFKPNIFFEKPYVFEETKLINQSQFIEKNISTGDFIKYSINSQKLNIYNLNWFITLWKQIHNIYMINSSFDYINDHKIERAVNYTYKNLYPLQTIGFEINLIINQKFNSCSLEEVFGFFFFLTYYIEYDSFIVLKIKYNDETLVIE